MSRKLPQLLIYLSAIILLTTGLAKVISASGSAEALEAFDPVIGLRFKDLFLIAGASEIIVASFCMWPFRVEVRTSVIAWIGTLFWAYRLAAIGLHYRGPCGCLGSMTEALHISPHLADNVMKGVLAYLLISSYGTLFWLWREQKNAECSSAPFV